MLNLRLWSAAKPLVQVNLLDLCQRLALVRHASRPLRMDAHCVSSQSDQACCCYGRHHGREANICVVAAQPHLVRQQRS